MAKETRGQEPQPGEKEEHQPAQPGPRCGPLLLEARSLMRVGVLVQAPAVQPGDEGECRECRFLAFLFACVLPYLFLRARHCSRHSRAQRGEEDSWNAEGRIREGTLPFSARELESQGARLAAVQCHLGGVAWLVGRLVRLYRRPGRGRRADKDGTLGVGEIAPGAQGIRADSRGAENTIRQADLQRGTTGLHLDRTCEDSLAARFAVDVKGAFPLGR